MCNIYAIYIYIYIYLMLLFLSLTLVLFLTKLFTSSLSWTKLVTER